MRSRHWARLFAVVFAGGMLAAPARAAVKPNGLFTDNMVLQQGRPIPVWGTADDGEEVTVSLDGQTAKATAQGGKWRVDLPAAKAGGPFTLTIQGKEKVELKDVLVGEVWLCSGQSNMEWPLAALRMPEDFYKSAENPKIRLFTVPRRGAASPETDVKGEWVAADAKSLPRFSAVAYFFGRDLQKALNVPVGLINTNVGGTAAEQWTSREALEAHPETRNLPETNKNSCGLYNAMIHPLKPFAIKGAIWYQGESNAGKAHQYEVLFPTMIRDWRTQWGQGDFPFLFVQLAPFMAIKPEPSPSNWAELREAQRLTVHDTPMTGMAVITDVGDEKNIHPPKKEPVGARLALLARTLAYGDREVRSQSPDYRSVEIQGDRAIVRFRHAGGGLEARGDKLTGFTIAGADGKFVNADATIDGETVVVHSDQVSRPVAVRFGWADYPVVNLWGKTSGLPATPFRTDDFPLITRDAK